MAERFYRPLFVVDGAGAKAAVLAELLGAGWTVGPLDPAAVGRLVVLRTVVDATDAEAAVLIALQGAGLVVHGDIGRQVVRDVIEDFGRLDPVVTVDDTQALLLDVDTWRLLHAIGAGVTLAHAARALHLSLRTANRRLTDAREVFGAPSRAQLLTALTGPGRVRPPGTRVSRR